MRISDWSSDVCSSDLPCRDPLQDARNLGSGRFGVGSRHSSTLVIPAKAGIQSMRRLTPRWIPAFAGMTGLGDIRRSEEHTSELQSLMRISYAVFCLKKKKHTHHYSRSNLTRTTITN